MNTSNKDEKCPLVSIIIVNFNGREFLKRCLTSFLNTDYPHFEVIVVDNGSTDGSVDLVERLFGSHSCIKIVKNCENSGHAEGCNIGARTARGEFLVFLDSDTEMNAPGFVAANHEDLCVSDDWLWELVRAMERDESIGVAQAKILLAKDRSRLDHTGIAVDALGTWHTTYGSKENEFRKNFEIFAASSGCCITRRKVFNEIGGFDSDYFIYDDDTDLSFRTRLLGYRIYFVSSSKVTHHGDVLRGARQKNVYHSAKNKLCTVLKNYELKNLWWRILTLGFLTFAVSVGFLILKKNKEAQETIKGLLYPMHKFRTVWKKRVLIQSKRSVRDVDLMNKGLIRNGLQSTLQDVRLKLRSIMR